MHKKILILIFFILNFSFLILNCPCQWQTYTLPYQGIAHTVEFYSMSNGISCGNTLFPFTGRIYYTTSSGNNWMPAVFPAEIRAILNLQFINSSTVYACGAQNGNIMFSEEYVPGFISMPFHLRQRLISKGISEYFSEYKTAFLKSTDAGMTWTKAGQFDTTTGYMNDIHFFNVNTGYAIIDTNPSTNPKFYKTTNAGLNWNFVNKISDSLFLDNMHFFDMNTGFVCGGSYNLSMWVQHGLIFKTTNGGLNWIKTVKYNSVSITDFAFFNSTTGIAVAPSNSFLTKIYRTTNAGNTWDSVSTFSNTTMFNVKCIPSYGIAFAAGNLNTDTSINKISTAKSTDYGLHWTLKELNQYDLISGISLVNQNYFYLSGGLHGPAVILKSTNGGNVFVNRIGSEVPQEFKLEQNYPNPFNSVTKIQFKVESDKFVKLIVFDLLGKEAAMLVNEELPTGTYEVSFDASSLVSGIYFYRLTAGDFSETKKFVLMK